MIQLSLHPLPGGYVELRSPYDEAAVVQFRSMPGVRWDAKARVWVAPVEAATSLVERLQKARIAKVRGEVPEPRWNSSYLPASADGMMGHQKEGMDFLVSRLRATGGALLADEMGLGKSLQALRTIRALSDRGRLGGLTFPPVLILCPAVVVRHWQNEISKWLDLPSVKLSKGKSTWLGGFAVCSYDTFRSIVVEKPPPGGKRDHYRVKDVSAAKYVVLDEIHYLSSYKAKRSKAVKKYIEQVEPHGVIGLSGTPMLVRPKDIWHPLDLLWPDRFGNFFSFSTRFCNGHWEEIEGVDRKIWSHDGATNLGELSARLKPLMLRRARADVLELPPQQRVLLPVEMPAEVAKSLSRAYATMTSGESVQKALSDTEGHKMDAAVQLATDMVVQGKRPLIFTTRKRTAEALAKKLGWPWVHGDTPPPERRDKLLSGGSGAVATMYSVTTGIDLIEFDVGIFCGIDYVPSTLLQAEGRLYRVGQTKSVLYYYLIGLGTVDEAVQRTVIERLEHFVELMGVAPEEEKMIGDLRGADDDELLQSIVEMVKAMGVTEEP